MASLENVNPSSNSPEFLQQVQLAVDGALRPDEERAFFKRINNCPNCLEMYYNERKYKSFMKKKVVKKCCEKDVLIQRIKSHLTDDFRTH